MTTNTKRPWFADGDGVFGGHDGNARVAKCCWLDDAPLIAKTVNVHDSLVAALKDVVYYATIVAEGDAGDEERHPMSAGARKAIKKALRVLAKAEAINAP